MVKVFFFSIIFSVNAFAVVTKYCAQEMTVSVPEIQVFSKFFVDKRVDSFISGFLDPEVDRESINYFLDKNLLSLNLDLELVSKKNSVCSYKVVSELPGHFTVRISGTDKDTKLIIDYSLNSLNYRMFAAPSSKRPTYEFTSSTLQIKTFVTSENWGETELSYISVGKGVIENTNEESKFFIYTFVDLKNGDSLPEGEVKEYEVNFENYGYKDLYLQHYMFEFEDTYDIENFCYTGDPKYTVDLISKIINEATGDSWLKVDGPVVMQGEKIVYPFSYVDESGDVEIEAVVSKCK